MGHIRLKRLPVSRKWQQVVALLAEGAKVRELAAASADAAEGALQSARRDPVLAHSLWLLTQIPIAARSPNFNAATRALGLNVSSNPTLVEVVAAFSDAVDRATLNASRRTDFGEMARMAAAESLSAIAGAGLPTLFGSSPDDVRLALGKLAAPDRFAHLARDFFARLTRHHLDYYLSRTLPNFVGAGKSLAAVADHSAFNSALDQHCRETSRIVEEFAGGWFSKTTFRGGVTPEKARDFAFVALGKISAELKARGAEDA
jgi:hypothetical protein